MAVSPNRWAELVPHGRILLIRPSAVGDVLMAIPSLEAIRRTFPGAHIGYLVEDRARDLIAGHPSIDRVHLFPRKRWTRALGNPPAWRQTAREIGAFVRELRDERYDASVNFQGNLKGALLSLASGAPRRIGYASVYAREYSHWFANVRVAPGSRHHHRAEKFFALAEYLGARPDLAAYRLPDSPESTARVGAFLEGQRLTRYAVIHPGTSDFGRAKRWPPERFAQVADRVKGLGLRAVIAWGPGEKPVAQEIVSLAGTNAVLGLETRSLLDLAELIRRARLFIGCDSGPMHLSSAVGTPCVAIFGPFDPTVYGPYLHPRFIAVQPPPGGGGRTDAITVEQVMDAAGRLVPDGAAPPAQSRPSP